MVGRTDLEITCIDPVNFHFAIILPTALLETFQTAETLSRNEFPALNSPIT